MARLNLGLLLLFGSPVIAVAVNGGIVIALAAGLIPMPYMIFNALPLYYGIVWTSIGFLGAVGSAVGGWLMADSPPQRWLCGVSAFFAGAVGYLAFNVIPLGLYILYVMTFRFV